MLYKLTTKDILTESKRRKQKIKKKIEKHSGCKFFHRVNLDAEDFDIFLEISKIQNYIIQSNKEKLKKEKKSK